MAYRRYSTKNADYVQAYCIHERITNEEVLSSNNIKNFDAVILESGQFLYPGSVIGLRQYSKIEQQLRLNNQEAKVYITDVALSKEVPRKDFIENFSNITMCLGGGAYLAYYFYHRFQDKKPKKVTRRNMLRILFGVVGYSLTIRSPLIASTYLTVSEGDASPTLPKFVENRFLLTKNPTIVMRNAVNAEKIDGFVAPRLKSELGRRPNIALVYGAAHAGLETCIVNKEHRNELLNHFAKEGFNLELPDQLDKVVEMQFSNNAWNFEILSSGLFR